MSQRTIFFVSDQTGITAETLGHSLLTQFEGITFRQVTLPFVETVDKAKEASRKINLAAQVEGVRPIVFSTLVRDELADVLQQSQCLFLDMFDAFIGPLERELNVTATQRIGREQREPDSEDYNRRIDAVNYALAHDDGLAVHDYGEADLILVGVSRSGKTPTSLYMALNWGILVANYPLTDDDLETDDMPSSLSDFREKLFGLTIDAGRLVEIRNERRPESKYASARQVGYELRTALSLFKRHRIPFIDTTKTSIEEISTTVLQKTGIERRARP